MFHQPDVSDSEYAAVLRSRKSGWDVATKELGRRGSCEMGGGTE